MQKIHSASPSNWCRWDTAHLTKSTCANNADAAQPCRLYIFVQILTSTYNMMQCAVLLWQSLNHYSQVPGLTMYLYVHLFCICICIWFVFVFVFVHRAAVTEPQSLPPGAGPHHVISHLALHCIWLKVQLVCDEMHIDTALQLTDMRGEKNMCSALCSCTL